LDITRKTNIINLETACVHAARVCSGSSHNTGAITVPIYQTATFAHPQFGQSTGYDYTRTQNPTVEYTEKLLCELEGGKTCSAFSTGMAAIATVMELFKPDDEIIATDDLYGGSIRLFSTISAKNGVKIRYVDTSDLQAVKSAITANTKAIFIETPTNPMMKVTDVSALSEMIHKNNNELLLIVDNTFLTPYLFRPIEHGADIVIHSGTKYLGGHNDTLAGFVVCKSPEVGERIRVLKNTIGAVLSPFDAFLISRGIKTLALRMEKSQDNARKIVTFLKTHSRIKEVYYAGIGSMISFRVECPETAIEVLNRVKLILYAESLGGVETLVTYPITQTHAEVPESERKARGIDESLLRLSVGIESAEDLITDLKNALAKI